MAIEEPKFTVVAKAENYEVRKYAPVLVAETVVEASFEEAGNQSFRILADYIFGNNRSRVKVAMTAPVTQEKRSEKIAMTAPVSQSRALSGYLVQFTMPASFTLDTLPEPNDPRVKLRLVPERRVAVFRYSGGWSEARYAEKLAEFKSLLKKDGLDDNGTTTLSRYDPPFMPWFLRRNEIWIEQSPRE